MKAQAQGRRETGEAKTTRHAEHLAPLRLPSQFPQTKTHHTLSSERAVAPPRPPGHHEKPRPLAHADHRGERKNTIFFSSA